MDAAPSILETGADDRAAIRNIHRRAFGGDVEARLVDDLLADPDAEPRLSLMAQRSGVSVGHVLFTAARIEGAPQAGPAAILAPLAVDPNHQGCGIGRALVEGGLDRLQRDGTALVLVLGDPAYYGRFGFEPALAFGLRPPHALVPEYEGGWRVRFLHDERSGAVAGRVVCAGALARPELWSP